MNLGTIKTEDGYAYDGARNEALAQNVISATAMPNGRTYFNRISNAEYATLEAAVLFSAVLHGYVDTAREATTARTSYPKYEVVIGEKRVNAGAIATVLGDDTTAMNDGAKAGPLAALLGEEYDAAIHVPLVRALKSAMGV